MLLVPTVFVLSLTATACSMAYMLLYVWGHIA